MLDIAYCCDDGYVPYVSVSMISCIENNINDFDKIVFHIVEEGVSDESKEKLKKIVNSYTGCEIVFYDFNPNFNFPKSNYPAIVYSLLFTPNLIQTDKLIFLDGDTLVLGSFKNLTKIDLKNNICGAVLDINHPIVKEKLGFGENDAYVNSGFVYMDLEKMREEKIQEKFLNEISIGYNFPDQDILNKVLKGKILILPPKYNFYGYFFELNYNNILKLFSVKGKTYSKKEVDESRKDIICTHFLNLFSDVPWRDDSNPMHEEFKKYADKSAFSNEEIFTQTNFPLWKIFAHKLIKKVPSGIYLPFAKKYMAKLFIDRYK